MPSEQPPTRVEGLTAEDRARLDELVEMAGRLASIGGFPENVADALTRALATLDHQTKALEAADELRSAALDLLDSLGEPHYHDLIGTTYTLHKEQADKLRTATRTTKGEDAGA